MKRSKNRKTNGTNGATAKVLAPYTKRVDCLGDMLDVFNEIVIGWGDASANPERLRGISSVNNQRLAFFRLAAKTGVIKTLLDRPALTAGKV